LGGLECRYYALLGVEFGGEELEFGSGGITGFGSGVWSLEGRRKKGGIELDWK